MNTGRARNRLKIMECLIGHGPMTRGGLAVRTGFSPATIAELLGELSSEGLVLAGKAAGAGPGRPKQVLQANAQAGHVIGIKLSMHEATICLTDFAGTALATRKLAHIAGKHSPAESAKLIAAEIVALLGSRVMQAKDVAGIGLGLPGFIESPSGRCLWSPVFSSRAEEFPKLLAEAARIPVLAENDVNLVTLAERWFGRGREQDHFMVITLEHGLGMGLWLNGELYSGASGLAAEFGHVIAEPGGAACRCGRKGCLEAYVSDGAMASRAAVMMGAPEPRDGEEVNRTMNAATAAAMEGHAALRGLFAQAGLRLGRAAANAANILAPGLIIVTGEAMRAEDLLMRPFSDGFQETLLPALRGRVGLGWHKSSDENWAKGAAARVLSSRFAGAVS